MLYQRVPVSDQTDPGEARRIVLLLAFLVVLSFWLQSQLGFELKKALIVPVLSAFWLAMGKLADWLGVKSILGGFLDSKVRLPLRSALQRVAKPLPLQVFGAALFTAMALLSSVSVRSEVASEQSTISIVPEGSSSKPRFGSLLPGRRVRFFPLLTSPFGRAFSVDAEGYLPGSVTVYPLISRQVLLGRDLAEGPSALFRPFEEGAVALLGRGVFRVTRLRGSARDIIATDSGRAASFMIGRPKPVTDPMVGLWSLELDALGVPPGPKAQLIMRWRRPVQLPNAGKLLATDRLVAEILLRGKLKARGEVRLDGGRLNDVLMQDTTAGGEVPPC